MTAVKGPRSQLEPVLRLLFDGAEAGEWRKCVVTPARANAGHVPWQRLTASPVRLARGTAIKLVTRAGGGERTSTLALEQWPERLLDAIEAGPCHLEVLAAEHDWHARRTRDGRWLVTRSRPSLAAPPATEKVAAHDRARTHPLPPDDDRVRELFIATGLYGKNGRLLGEAAPKFRQVQHYIELLRHLPIWTDGGTLRVVDAGCGKAYLSLALCLWAELNGMRVRLEGVDSSPEVIATVERIATKAGLREATFHATTISEFAGNFSEPVDLLLSLHACDTATDEALAAGVKLGAAAIVLVPCCHQELADQIERGLKAGSAPASEPWQSALGFGLLRHRLADIVTDSLRSAALEALGYRTDVLEFVSPEATARNLMIRATKRAPDPDSAARGLQRYRALAAEWDVQPALESLLGSLWPPAS